MSKIFLITAPSGAGKTSIAQSIANQGLWIECISHTTRKMRDGEAHGKTYFFVDEYTFEDMEIKGELAEKVKYNGNSYGISKAEIDLKLSKGKDVFIIVENDGYHQVKKAYPEAIGIFLYASKEDCMINMLSRGDNLKDALDRIKLYDDEMYNTAEYDYVIKNVRGKKFETENIIKSIIQQYKETHSILFTSTNGIKVTDGVSTKPLVERNPYSVDYR